RKRQARALPAPKRTRPAAFHAAAQLAGSGRHPVAEGLPFFFASPIAGLVAGRQEQRRGSMKARLAGSEPTDRMPAARKNDLARSCERAKSFDSSGADERSRTLDLLITNPF